MDVVFLKLLNMSITASWLILAVILLRFLLKKAPKWIMGVLWGFAAIRLICPFSFESIFSLIPSTEAVNLKLYTSRPFIDTGINAVDNNLNDYLGDHYFEGVTVPVNHTQHILTILGIIWGIGVIVMLLYTIISLERIRSKVQEAVLVKENIFECDRISSPFILGVLHPRIYLPSDMTETNKEYVLSHEKAHLKRKDHIWKPLGFLLLTIYWFNPILWIAYILLCKDIELACDEKVLNQYGSEIKKTYSYALINCSVPRRMISACPLAFGEVGVKERVKNVLSYKKPTFWIIIVAVLACIVTAVCLMTNPIKKEEPVSISEAIIGGADGPESIIISNKVVKSITDLTESQSEMQPIATDTALELFYSDTDFNYYFGSIKSKYIIVEYTDESKETVKSALQQGTIKISDLDKFGIGYIKKQKDANLMSDVDRFILSSIMQQLKRSDDPTGLIPVESHITLSSKVTAFSSDNDTERVTEYMIVYYEEYSHMDHKPPYSILTPAILTYDVNDMGTYTVADFASLWIPDEGDNFEKSIRDKFPSDIIEQAINCSDYAEQLKKSNRQKLDYLPDDISSSP